jgi:hypothetical protein
VPADQNTCPDDPSSDGVLLLKWAERNGSIAESLSQNPPQVQRPEMGQMTADRVRRWDQVLTAEL